MRNLGGAALAAAAALLLTGCAAPAPAPTVTITATVSPSPAPTVTITATPTPEAVVSSAPAQRQAPALDLSTDAGLCAADAELSNLELNDALAPMLGYPADRDQRTPDQDESIRYYKNAAFGRACPERAS